MLRLFASTARTSTRSLFTKPNASAYVSSHCLLSDKKESTDQKPFSQKETDTSQKDAVSAEITPVNASFENKLSWTKTIAFLLLGSSIGCWLSDLRTCKVEFYMITYDLAAVDAAAHSIDNKKPDPFEGAKVRLTLNSPWVFGLKCMNVLLTTSVHLRLPNIKSLKSGTPEFNEIYEGLKRRGIHVECSKEGVRRGLIEYAFRMTQNGGEKHRERCNCGYLPGPVDVPPT